MTVIATTPAALASPEEVRAAAQTRVWQRITSPHGELTSACIAGVLLLAGVLLHYLAGMPEAGGALCWASLALGLFHGGRAAVESLRKLKFDIDVLMVVGAVLAGVLGAPAEGALLLFLFVLSGALEALAMARTTRAVEALHKLMPTAAMRRVPGDGDVERWESIAPEQLVPGDVVKVLPGESIPADAVMLGDLATTGSVDQATLTGESMPRSIAPGDQIFAGTINAGGPMTAKVSRAASESSLQRILNLVIVAQQQREPVQRVIDRISQPYAIGVMLVSVAVFFVWWLVLVEPIWEPAGAAGEGGRGGALYTAITLLIVASPCAVIIATPTATLAAITRAARAGVLFKGGQSIERLSRLGAVCFDKTGTLTVGKPRVRELHPVGWSDELSLLAAASALEQDSTHPIAHAIREEAERRGVTPLAVESPTFTPGRGVSAVVDGKPARLGTLVHAGELVPVCLRQRVKEVLDSVQGHGNIAVVIVHDQQAGVVTLADTVRPGADRLVTDLHAMGVKPVVMLTGDNRATAASVAGTLGLDRFEAELLPEDKVAAVESLKRELSGKRQRAAVGVIGDGVNDAPALAAADVSIAIGSIGSDAALESADIVLLSDDLSVVPWAVGLARRARRTITINLGFALAVIVLFGIGTLGGSLTGHSVPLWLAVLGHEGGTLLVVAHSLLLLAHRSPRTVGCAQPPCDVARAASEDRAEPAVIKAA